MVLSDRLTKRFRGVPGVTSDDISDWITEAEEESGFTADDAENDRNNALLYLALSIAYSIIAADAARFFKYTDADESVDKTGIAEKYMSLSAQARRMYSVQLRGGYRASASFPDRADASEAGG